MAEGWVSPLASAAGPQPPIPRLSQTAAQGKSWSKKTKWKSQTQFMTSIMEHCD